MFKDRVKRMNDEYVAKAEQEIKQLREENDRLRNDMKPSQNRTEKVEEEVVQMKEAWGNKVDQAEIQLKAIIEEQKDQQENNIGKKVLNVISHNEKQVSEIMDRKRCVVMFGDIEEEQVHWNIRKKNCLKKVDNMLKALDKSGKEEWNKEVEDCWRLGKYSKGESRPLKIRFKSTKAAEEILNKSWKLSEDERYSKVIIRKDLNVEERNTMREINREVKEKNENRTEAEKEIFYYRNMDGKIRK